VTGARRTTLLAASALLALCWRTRALAAGDAAERTGDAEQAQIDALVAADHASDALPLALARARRLGKDRGAWDQVRKLAGWTSSAAAELEALRHVVELAPDDRDARFALAQRLLWKRLTTEAAPHARWLLARTEERDAVVLETVFWIFAAEKDWPAAREAARRWIAAAPHAPAARWALADVTHWTARWREARLEYEILRERPAERARAEARLELLRREHPTKVQVDGDFWRDSVGVQRRRVGAGATVQAPARLVLEPRVDVTDWSQRSGPRRGDEVTTLALATRVRAELWDAVAPEASFGLELDTARNAAPVGSVGVRLAVAGRLFGTVGVGHERFRVSLEAARQDIRAIGPFWSLYYEPVRWFFASSEASLTWLSDDNRRTRVLGAVGVHNAGAFQVEPRVFAVDDRYESLRPGAVPYFTLTKPFVVGADLTLRARIRHRVTASVSAGLVVQEGTVAFRPSGAVSVRPGDNLELGLSGAYVGSPEYAQRRLDAVIGWHF
jgi:hypothetical protein